MDDNIKLIIDYGLAAVVGIGSWFMKSILGRVSELEKDLTRKVSEPEVRQILTDKLTPMEEDIREMRLQLNELYKMLIKRYH